MLEKFKDWVIAGRDMGLINTQMQKLSQYIDKPLLLISQERRSGGTLMSQLFDFHPQVFSHPHELKTGYPTKSNWPPISCSRSCSENWRFIQEGNKFQGTGYRKGKYSDTLMGYVHPYSLNRALFRYFWDLYPPKSERDIFNIYFSAYFGSWLNARQNLVGEEKKYVTGFCAVLMSSVENVDKFFNIYPDGRYVAVLREPYSWLNSAYQHSRFEEWSVKNLLGSWARSTEAMIYSSKTYPESTTIVCFEDLILKTELTMRRILNNCSISYADSISVPTFNGYPMESSSNFGSYPAGKIDKSVVTRSLDNLEKKNLGMEVDRILPLYDKAKEYSEKI